MYGEVSEGCVALKLHLKCTKTTLFSSFHGRDNLRMQLWRVHHVEQQHIFHDYAPCIHWHAVKQVYTNLKTTPYHGAQKGHYLHHSKITSHTTGGVEDVGWKEMEIENHAWHAPINVHQQCSESSDDKGVVNLSFGRTKPCHPRLNLWTCPRTRSRAWESIVFFAAAWQ